MESEGSTVCTILIITFFRGLEEKRKEGNKIVDELKD